MGKIPDSIFLPPEDAALFNQKYGHPHVKQVWVGDTYVKYVRADELDRIKKAGQELADEFKKCRRIMQNRQPDKLADGVYIADRAIDAWNAAVKGESHD